MKKRPIKDIPSFKKPIEELQNMQALGQAAEQFIPFLKSLDVDTNKLPALLDEVQQIEASMQELASLPDRFNDLFATRGWIMYDRISTEVAKQAIEMAEAGDISGAENILVDYYSDDLVTRELETMFAVQAFHSRMTLARKAVDDYCNQRYHACVPVVLALMDGMVNEVHEKRRGFFAEETNLEAWDSIAAHDKGLNVLAKVLRLGRYKTYTDSIEIPYRNGILHGMDLGYDNRIVAAKTWAALFATRDWAILAEKGLINAPSEEPPVALEELVQHIINSEKETKRLETWRPRNITPGVDILSTGEAGLFDPATPEQKLAQYLNYWKASNYGFMAKCMSKKLNGPPKLLPKRLNEQYKAIRLLDFQFLNVHDEAPAITNIEAELSCESGGSVIVKTHKFRLVFEGDDGIVAMRGKTGGTWAVLTWPPV